METVLDGRRSAHRPELDANLEGEEGVKRWALTDYRPD